MDNTATIEGCSCGMADYGAPGHDGEHDASRASDTNDNDGLVRTRVSGVDAQIYAHRSNTVAGALLVGVDAPEGQRIMFVVNDGDVLDTTVGLPSMQVAGAHDGGEQARASTDLCLACSKAACTNTEHESLLRAIRRGRALAETAAKPGRRSDPITAISDTIANLLLYAADAYGVDAAQQAVDAAQMHFYGDWTDAGRPWGSDDPQPDRVP